MIRNVPVLEFNIQYVYNRLQPVLEYTICLRSSISASLKPFVCKILMEKRFVDFSKLKKDCKKDYCICFTQVLFPLSAGPEYFVFWLRIAKLVFS